MAIAERLRQGSIAVLVAGFAACGGAEEPAVVGTPAGGTPQAAATAPDTGLASDTVSSIQDNTGLVREAFSYRSAGRDPFESLLRTGSVRPLPQDLRVTGITFDPRYPQRSVATVRDTTSGRRYSLRIGDQVGRLRVSEIRTDAVVVILEELGAQRQVVLALRRRQEAIP